MQARLRKAGVRPVYVPAARVWHYVPAERSSPAWAEARAYRHGVQAALQIPRGRISLFSCPPWLVGRLVTSTLRYAVACWSNSPSFRLSSRIRRNYNRGLIHGFRMRAAAARNDALALERSDETRDSCISTRRPLAAE